MPAKRSPKKSRKPSAKPSVADVTPPDLDSVAVAPVMPVDLPVAAGGREHAAAEGRPAARP